MPNGIFPPGPPRGGIFRPPQEPEEEEKKKELSVLDRIAEIFTGPRDPRLSAEQQESVRNQALIQAGLATMAGGGRTGLERLSLLEAISGGAMAGREAGAGARRSAVIGQLAGESPEVALETYQRMFIDAIGRGDDETARSLSTVINAMEASLAKRTQAENFIYRTVGNEIIVIDPTTGSEVSRITGPAVASGRMGSPVAVYDPDKGQDVLAVWDQGIFGYREIGTGKPMPNAQPKQGTAEPVSEDRAVLGQLIIDDLDMLGQKPVPPNFVKFRAYRSDLARWAISAEDQLYLAALEKISANVVRLLSGAQASEKEVKRVRENFLPAPGDKVETTAWKIGQMKKLATALAGGMSIDDALDEAGIEKDEEAARNRNTPIFDQYRENR